MVRSSIPRAAISSTISRISGDHSYYPTIMDMKDGNVKGCFVFGQNFAVGGPHVRMARDGLRNLDWLVVLDAYGIETAEAWKLDGAKPEECGAEVFFIPCALVAEKDGSFTQTQRFLQWHDKAVESPGDARSDAWFVYHLGRRIKELYKGSKEARRSRKGLDLGLSDRGRTRGTTHREHPQGGQLHGGRRGAGGRVRRAPGRRLYRLRWLDLLRRLRRWREPRPRPQTGRQPEPGVGLGLADEPPHPLQPRLRRPEGKPWSERKKYIWWDENEEKWVGDDVVDFEATKPPSYRPDEEARGVDALPGDGPSS